MGPAARASGRTEGGRDGQRWRWSATSRTSVAGVAGVAGAGPSGAAGADGSMGGTDARRGTMREGWASDAHAGDGPGGRDADVPDEARRGAGEDVAARARRRARGAGRRLP